MLDTERVRALVEQIQALEAELEDEIHEAGQQVLYQISNRKVRFETQVREAHARLRVGLARWIATSRPRNVLSAPVIYAMIVPFALLDLWVSVYQALCFPLYGIPRVARADTIAFDRHHLRYLNGIERFNCLFCGYANGVIAYTREIAARTEQYWCPIKHARKLVGTHARYRHFLEYGEPDDYPAALERFRAELARERDAG